MSSLFIDTFLPFEVFPFSFVYFSIVCLSFGCLDNKKKDTPIHIMSGRRGGNRIRGPFVALDLAHLLLTETN